MLLRYLSSNTYELSDGVRHFKTPLNQGKVSVSLEQKSGLSYKLASLAGQREIQKGSFIAPLVNTMQLLHIYMTITCFFHDSIDLKPHSCSIAPQTPISNVNDGKMAYFLPAGFDTL